MELKRIKSIVVASFFFFPFLVVAVTPDTITVFTKNLKLGVTDQQVLLLQKVLNSDPDTVIATNGAGSPGNETSYFGQKTMLAVISFQNKYYGEVLAPNGLSVGTGYFGASTRVKMNALQISTKTPVQTSKTPKTPTTPPTTTQADSIGTSANDKTLGLGEKVKITSLNPTHGKDGTFVTINGSGFTKTANKIIAGGQTVYNATSTDGTKLTFTMQSPVSIPVDSSFPTASTTYIQEHFNEYKTSTFPVLKYPVCVNNDSGMSNCVFFIIDL